MGVALVSGAVTLAAYLVVAGVLGAVAYGAEPEEPEGGGHTIPEEPCAAVTIAQLKRVSATDPTSHGTRDGTSSETAPEEPDVAACAWHATFSDGTLGSLNLTFRVPVGDPDSNSNAQQFYESNAVEYGIISDPEPEAEGGREITIDDSRELDLGDDSFLVFAEEESFPGGVGEEPVPAAVALVHVRDANMNIQLRAYEATGADNEGKPDLADDEEALIAMAEQALASLA
ncbi:hypothetical protein F4561_005844 [Lipingzhangella halophila]|uniref:DUF3558 domain-containing protein n=1 Tax=Lipingzhangella halophila TaxID=1783352 RepID=A0A7W7W6L1_9ACTN|nr:hypothetical protein [Lipingzhangella halophila]MBB4934950.1 hypothetical protein [Lipingzhangella halophila]